MNKEYRILDHTTGSTPAQEFQRVALRSVAHYIEQMGGSAASVAELQTLADRLVPTPCHGWRMVKRVVNGYTLDIIEPEAETETPGGG